MSAPLSVNAHVEVTNRCACEECCPRNCSCFCIKKEKKAQVECIHRLSQSSMDALHAAAEIDKQRKHRVHHKHIPRSDTQHFPMPTDQSK